MLQHYSQTGAVSHPRQSRSFELIRWSALAAILGGAAFVAEGVIFLTAPGTLQDPFMLLGYFLVALGLIGFHAFQRERDGLLGRVGFYTAVAGSLAGMVAVLGSLTASANLEWLHGIGFLSMIVGYILYGIATLRAKMLPRWYGIIFLLIGPISLVPVESSVIAFGLIWGLLGCLLWRRESRPAAPVEQVA